MMPLPEGGAAGRLEAGRTIEMPYGGGRLGWTVPKEGEWHLLANAASPAQRTEREVVEEALVELASAMRRQGLDAARNILFVVPDVTRRCRVETLLPALVRNLSSAPGRRFRIVVANGSHDPQPDETVRSMLGDGIADTVPVEQHDARDDSRLQDWGTTRAGTPVRLNRLLRDAEALITVSAVRFHYFAGLGGGPKMIFPGLAAAESIRRNHCRTLDASGSGWNAMCQEGKTAGNPVYEDLVEAASMVPRVLSFQVVIGGDGNIVAAAAGGLCEAQQRLIPEVERHEGIRIARRADVVLASAGGFPADINLIQSHKSIHHAFGAVRPGGWLVVMAECSQGIGSRTFLAAFDATTSAGMARRLSKDYQLNGHTALALKTKAEAARVILVSRLEPSTVRRMGLIAAGGLEEAWEIVSSESSENVLGYVMPNAAASVPRLTEEDQ